MSVDLTQRASSRTTSSPLPLMLLLSLLMLCPQAALAQDDTGNESFLSSSSTTTTSTALVTALGVLTVVSLTPKPGNRALRLYLEQNAVAVRAGASCGAGDAVADLAQAFAIPQEHTHHFGRLLRQERHVLLEILEDERVSDEETLRLIRHLHAAMSRHPELERAARALQG